MPCLAFAANREWPLKLVSPPLGTSCAAHDDTLDACLGCLPTLGSCYVFDVLFDDAAHCFSYRVFEVAFGFCFV